MDFLRQRKKGQLSPKLNKSLWKTQQGEDFSMVCNRCLSRAFRCEKKAHR
jgi:hypothetical protein